MQEGSFINNFKQADQRQVFRDESDLYINFQNGRLTPEIGSFVTHVPTHS